MFFEVIPKETPGHKENPHPCFQSFLFALNEPVVKHPKGANASHKMNSEADTSRYGVSFEVQVEEHP